MSALLIISWGLFLLAAALTVAVVVSAIRDRQLRRTIASMGKRTERVVQWRQRMDGDHAGGDRSRAALNAARSYREVDEPAPTVDSAYIARQVRKYKNAYEQRANPKSNKHRSLYDSHAAIDLFADTV